MPNTDAGLDAGLNGRAAAGARIAFFTADPGNTGANEVSGTGRPTTTWGPVEASTNPVGRQRVGSQVTAPIPAGTTVTHWGVFTAATGGALLLAEPLAAQETFGSAGEIKHTPTLLEHN